ncbi:MAG TPA: BatA and WFA domain-containing protein [Gemmatimonadaceae bacterium]|nr:BatA and WFA domain-containing protein [Gemmatimonadaceae bacterium]
MTFLSTWWLLLAAAAAVPVVIHLFRRRIGTRVEFPTARYLARAEAEHSRELRLRNTLLMLLRAAAIVFVSLAAARPFVAVPGGARAPGALAIVLDNSMSSAAVSGGTSTFDVLRGAARQAANRLRMDDRAWLITADAQVLSAGRDALLARLDSATPFAGRGNIQRAVELGYAAVAGSGLPGEIAVFTDAQASQWDSAAATRGARVVFFVPGGAPPDNRAVVEARPEPLRFSSGSGALTVALLSSDSALYRITVGGQPIARGVAEPDARITVPLLVSERGWFAGTAETERDELPLDDVRHFAALAGEPPAVSAQESAGQYARTAVSTLADRGRLRVGAMIHVAAADDALRLPALLLPPLDPVRAVAANQRLERLAVPWRLGRIASDSVPVVADSAAFGGALSPFVRTRYRLEHLGEEPTRPVDTLALAAGEPWAVAGPGYVLLGSRLDPQHTSLPVSAAFLPWIERVLAHRLTEDARGIIEAAVGDTVRLPSWAEGVEGAVLTGGAFVPAVPAVHFLTGGGGRIGAVVANVPRSESLLQRLTDAALRERASGARTVVVTSDPVRLQRALLTARGRTDMTAAALVIAGILLVLEMTLRSSRRGTRTNY